jgi:hypothetical protein
MGFQRLFKQSQCQHFSAPARLFRHRTRQAGNYRSRILLKTGCRPIFGNSNRKSHVTTQLNFSAASNPLSALAGAGLADAKGAPGGPDSAAGSHFAELFTGHMLKLERQGFAAEQDALGGLQMMSLGPSINVITSDAPVPDMQSLVAFAKAQGLDEAAVAGLFGDIPMPAQPFGGVLPLAGTAGATAAPVSALGIQVPSPSATLPTLGMLQAMPGVSIQGIELGPTAASGEVLPPTSTADVLAGLGIPATKGAARAPEPASMVASVLNLDAVANMEANAQKVEAHAQNVAQAAALGATLHTALAAAKAQAAEAGDIAPLDATPPPPVMVDALRVQMGIPSAEITRRLAQLTGEQAPVSWAELVAQAGAREKAQLANAASLQTVGAAAAQGRAIASAAGQGPDAALALAILPAGMNPLQTSGLATNPIFRVAQPDALPAELLAEEALSIEVPPDWDLGAMQDQAGAPTEGVGNARQGSNPAGAAPNPQTSAEGLRAQIQEREAQTQALADRMGVAMAKKLISQIERGQWKLQMRLQPAALGRVEVALDMHAGGLDAVFSTDNAFTKELLGQGSQRLRDALTQSGTTVASVTVNADAQGQSGGNSTPQKRQPAPQQSAPAVAAGAGPARAARYTAGVAEGLNVLA